MIHQTGSGVQLFESMAQRRFAAYLPPWDFTEARKRLYLCKDTMDLGYLMNPTNCGSCWEAGWERGKQLSFPCCKET